MGEGRGGAILDPHMQTLCVDNQLIHSLSRQLPPPDLISVLCSAPLGRMVLVKVYSKLQAHYTSYMDMDKFFLVWGYNFHYTACLASCVLQHPQAPTCLPIAL